MQVCTLALLARGGRRDVSTFSQADSPAGTRLCRYVPAPGTAARAGAHDRDDARGARTSRRRAVASDPRTRAGGRSEMGGGTPARGIRRGEMAGRARPRAGRRVESAGDAGARSTRDCARRGRGGEPPAVEGRAAAGEAGAFRLWANTVRNHRVDP